VCSSECLCSDPGFAPTQTVQQPESASLAILTPPGTTCLLGAGSLHKWLISSKRATFIVVFSALAKLPGICSYSNDTADAADELGRVASQRSYWRPAIQSLWCSALLSSFQSLLPRHRPHTLDKRPSMCGNEQLRHYHRGPWHSCQPSRIFSSQCRQYIFDTPMPM